MDREVNNKQYTNLMSFFYFFADYFLNAKPENRISCEDFADGLIELHLKLLNENIINKNNCYIFIKFIKTVLEANNRLIKDLIKEIENILRSEIKEKIIKIIEKVRIIEDKELTDLFNLIEEFGENIDEIEFKLKIQKIINPNLNKLDNYYVEKNIERKEEKKNEEKEEKEEKEKIGLETLINNELKDSINEIYTLINDNYKKIKEITNEIEKNKMAYGSETIFAFISNKCQNSLDHIIKNEKEIAKFERLEQIKCIIENLKVYQLFSEK